jgi:hypothetical protein
MLCPLSIVDQKCSQQRAAKLLKLVRKNFSLIVIVWKWIIEHTLKIPFMTLMGMILERKMLIMCLMDNYI